MQENRGQQLHLVEEQKKPAGPNQAGSATHRPLVILSAGGALLFKGKRNDSLINALIQMGITEIYLLTSCELREDLGTPTERAKNKRVLLTTLLSHLEGRGITVKAIVSYYDLMPVMKEGELDFLDNIPGQYYTKFIAPFEKLILKNAAIDLTAEPNYLAQIQKQDDDRALIEKMIAQSGGQIKVLLTRLLFSSLKKTGVISPENPWPVLFFDESATCFAALKSEAEKNGLQSAHCRLVSSGSTLKNYCDFLLRARERNIQRVVGKQKKMSRLQDDLNELNTVLQGKLLQSLITLVQDYLAPTPEILDAVRENLKKLCDYNDICDWRGVSVPMTTKSVCGENKEIEGISLEGLQLDGIVFNEAKEGNFSKMREQYLTFHRDKPGNYYELSPYHPWIDFSGASLKGAKLENLFGMELFMCNVDFSDAQLENASFKVSNLVRLIFSRAQMAGADLSFCNGEDPKGRSMRMADRFSKTNLERAKLCNSDFSHSDFSETILDDADLSHGVFDFAQFIECSMKRAILTGSRFVNVRFFCKGGLRTDLTGANAENVDFQGASLYDAIFQDVIFKGANLTNAIFKATNKEQKDADLTGARMAGACYYLKQFTREQVLSFYYQDPHACLYLAEIYDYMEKNNEKKHKKTFERARELIVSFINHDCYDERNQNTLLTAFLLTGKLPGEKEQVFSSFFSEASGDTDPNSLRSRLAAVRKEIERVEAPKPLNLHLRKSSGGV